MAGRTVCLPPPQAATSITTASATLNGTVNGIGQSTAVTFEYGSDTTYGNIVIANQSPVTGETDTAVSKAMSGFTANTLYHYRVDAVNATGTTYGLDQTFTTNAIASTVTTVTSSLNPSTFGQTVTFTATVTSGSGTPTGTATFMDGATVLNTTALTSGVATFSTATLAVGSHTITASYNGDSNFSTSNGTLTGGQVVNASNTVVVLVPSPSPIAFGQTAAFTATVGVSGVSASTRKSATACALAGTVTFKDGVATLGSSSLDANCQAIYTTTALGVGTHTITAQYSGNTNYSSGTSNPVTMVVNTTPSKYYLPLIRK